MRLPSSGKCPGYKKHSSTATRRHERPIPLTSFGCHSSRRCKYREKLLRAQRQTRHAEGNCRLTLDSLNFVVLVRRAFEVKAPAQLPSPENFQTFAGGPELVFGILPPEPKPGWAGPFQHDRAVHGLRGWESGGSWRLYSCLLCSIQLVVKNQLQKNECRRTRTPEPPYTQA